MVTPRYDSAAITRHAQLIRFLIRHLRDEPGIGTSGSFRLIVTD